MNTGEVLTLISGATLGATALGVLWRISASMQGLRDATRANTRATDRLTDQMSGLTERVARLEGPRGRRLNCAHGA